MKKIRIFKKNNNLSQLFKTKRSFKNNRIIIKRKLLSMYLKKSFRYNYSRFVLILLSQTNRVFVMKVKQQTMKLKRLKFKNIIIIKEIKVK